MNLASLVAADLISNIVLVVVIVAALVVIDRGPPTA